MSARASFNSVFAGFPRAYWVLWAGALINRLGSFVFTFLALYLTDARGFSAQRAGVVVASYGTGAFLAAMLGGYVADRFGRRFALLAGTSSGAIGLLVLGAATSEAAILFAAFFAGLLNDSYRPALNAAVADVVPEADRPRAFATLYWAVNLGFAGSTSIAGWLAGFGYGWLFVIDALTTLTLCAFVWAWFPESRPAPRPGAVRPKADVWAPFQHRRFVMFLAAQLWVVLVFMQSNTALPLDMRAKGMSAATFGSLVAINGIMIVLLQPVFIKFGARWPMHVLLSSSAFITGLGFSLHALAQGPGMFAVAIILWTAGEILGSAAAPAFVAQCAPPERRGVYQGAYHMLWGGSFALAPLIGTYVYGRFGANTLWLACLAVCVVASFALFRVTRTVASSDKNLNARVLDETSTT